MSQPKISLIAAISKTRVLGNSKGKTWQEQIPWHIPADLKHFRQLTSGHVVIMGRTTFQSLGKPLPNRTNIVVSRDQGFKAEGAIICLSLDEALKKAAEIEIDEIFIIGGAQVYTQTINRANRLYLTIVKGDFEGDIFFPEYESKFNVLDQSDWIIENETQFQFQILE